MELELAASTFEVTESGLLLRWSDGSRSRFHALWLRDNCSTGGPKGSDLRTFSVVDLNPELFVLDAEPNEDGDLVVEFSDGHESVFTFDWLRQHSHEPHDRQARVGRVEHFRAGTVLPRFDLPRRESERHLELLESVRRFGAAVVDGVPVGDDGVEMLVDLLGGTPGDEAARSASSRSGSDVRDDVVMLVALRTQEASRAQRAALCVWSGGRDGSTNDVLLVDGFAVAAELQDLDPDSFDLLTNVSVPFLELDAQGQPLNMCHGPVIVLDRDYQIAGIRFDESAMGALDIEPAEVGEYYRSLITLATNVRDPSRAVQVTVRSGQALIVDNNRVLCSGTFATMAMASVDHADIGSMRRHLENDA